MGDRSTTRPRWFLQRPLPAAMLALTAIAALIAGFLWTNRITLAEHAAVAVLAKLGVAPASLTIDALTLRGATLSKVAVGPNGAQHVARIGIAYSLFGLSEGRIDSLKISNARLNAVRKTGELVFPGLEALMTGPGGGSIEIQRIAVDKFSLAVDTVDGSVTLSGGQAIANDIDGDRDISADITIRSISTAISANFDGRLTATFFSTGEILGRISVQDGNITAPNGNADAVRGEVQIIVGAKGPEIDARFDVRQLTFGDQEIQNAQINLAVQGQADKATIDAEILSRDGQVSLRGTARLTQEGSANFEGTSTLSLTLADINAALQGDLKVVRDSRGALSGDFKIRAARLRYKDIAIDGITGTSNFTATGVETSTFNAALRFQRMQAPNINAGPGALSIDLDEQSIQARGVLTTSDGQLTLGVHGPLGKALDYEAKGQLAIAPLLAVMVNGIDGQGQITFNLAGSAPNPFHLPANLNDALTVTGTVEAAIREISIPKLLLKGEAQGHLELSLLTGEWRIASKNLQMSATSIADELLSELPSALRNRLADGVRLAVSGPTNLHISPSDNRYEISVTGAAQLDAKDAALTLHGGARATIDSTGTLITPPASKGRYSLKASQTSAIIATLAPITIQANVAGNFALDDEILSITATPASRVTLYDVSVPNRAELAAPMVVAPEALLRARLDLAGTPRLLTLEGAIGVSENSVAVATEAKPITVKIAPATFRIAASGERLLLTMTDGEFAVPERDLHVTGIDFTLKKGRDVEYTLAIDRIEQRGSNPISIPLRMNVSAIQQDGLIEFTGRLFDAPERLLIQAMGRHDIAANSGGMSIDIPPLTFLPTVLQPDQLFPVLHGILSNVDGELGAHADLQWRDGDIQSSAELFAELSTLKVKDETVENLSTTITFDSLFPPSTPPKQEIYIGLLDIGVPLKKGRIEFQLHPDGQISAALRELDFFGGRIESQTVKIPPSLDGFSIPLEVTGVQLESLFALSEIGDLEATGTLNGKLPLAIEDGTIALRNGVLESAPGGGTIRYRPKTVGPALANANEGTALFLKVIHDFKYDSVSVTLNEDPSGGVASQFKVIGRNNAVYNGIPVELNISMSGPLRDILNQSVKTYTLPKRLLKRIQKSRNKNPLPSGN